MKWTDIDFHPPERVLRQFAAAWLLAVGSLSVHQWLVRGSPGTALGLAVAALIIGITGLIRPSAIRRLFVACTIAAFPIGWVVSHVMLAVLFLAVISPVALLFRLRGRDRLSRKRRAGVVSYWKPKTTPPDVRRYFRQY